MSQDVQSMTDIILYQHRKGVTLAASLIAFLVFMAAAPSVSAETLVTSLSSHRVLIDSNYLGTSLTVFGAIQMDRRTVARATDYDVVVTVRGPKQFITVRQKAPLGPLWINQDQQKFPTAPSYLSVLSSRPVEEITSEQLRERQKIGLSAILNGSDFTIRRDGAADKPFREALYRLKVDEGLYLEDGRGATFLTPTIFQVKIPLPATAPPGDYDVQVKLLTGTVILTDSMEHFELVKTGFGQQLGEASRDWQLSYGLATAFIAIFFGWIASVIFRRD